MCEREVALKMQAQATCTRLPVPSRSHRDRSGARDDLDLTALLLADLPLM
jgi:hypothetical protein